MDNTSSGESACSRRERINKIISQQKLIQRTNHQKWCIKSYWGQLPILKDVTRLGYCGYAITDDVENSGKPDLSSKAGTQVIIGDRSVIIWSANSELELDGKIKQTFNQFEWRKQI